MGKSPKDIFSNLVLPPVTDESGNAIEADDVLSRAMTPQEVTFEYDGLKYTTFILKTQVPSRLNNRTQGIIGKLAMRAGYSPNEQIEGDDERAGRFLELMNENDVLDAAYADLAVAATIIRDGKPLTNIPLVDPKKFGRESLLELGALGSAYINAVRDALNPTLAAEDGAEAAQTTKEASTSVS